jgi:hypothetical protein
MLLQVVNQTARVGNGVVHARYTVGWIGCRSHEHNAQTTQPCNRIGTFIHQNSTQQQVIPWRQIASMQSQVREMMVGVIFNTGTLLQMSSFNKK